MIIFVSHSSKDNEFIDVIRSIMKKIGVDFYQVETDMCSSTIYEQIREYVNISSAVVVILTSNVIDNKTTRDNVLFEIGAAYALHKDIYIFVEESVVEMERVPMATSYITGFKKFKQLDENTAKERAEQLNKKLENFKELNGHQNKISAMQGVMGTILDIDYLKNSF
ncbi:hypothetical protein BEH94_12085 [Candidatus Altiarchaeales archaeon WOR_SM1_SCG]|nr:hypothetical protein BEH94_12085 [Candidatus Altiarchaeales archaeon WOR_SM1_SCG]